jgi:glycosyltransferase involved in cell wall biosynthesis
MAPQLSVIMSAYNSSETVERAITSILNQSFSDFELIVMNDGSTDDTEEKILPFSDERIRYFLLEHAGLTKALNFGLSKASGEIIARHDSDDWSEPDRFATQMRSFEEDSDRDLVATWHNVVDVSGHYLGQKRTPLDDESLKNMLRWRNPFCHGSVLVRKSVLDKVGGYNEALLYSQDYDLWVRLGAMGATFYCVPETLYNYSITPGAIAKGWNKLANAKNIRDNALLPEHLRTYSIDDVTPPGKRQTESLWHYAVGSLALEDGRRVRAFSNFLRSLTKDPRNWRAFVRMGAVFVPGAMVGLVFGKAKERRERRQDD